ncbi:MAG TPA: cupin domain-containing protein [Acidimicrobiales bacterium]|nr:cupin domain-containing protein [Acidimicrobiales bacterium]
MTDTIVKHRDEGTLTWFLNSLVATKVDREGTAGAYCLMEHLLTPAADPPVHVHDDEDEAFYVLDGEVELEVGGDVVLATPGTYALAPSGTPHAFRVRTPTARMLVITSSATGGTNGGAEAFFRAAGTPAEAPVLPAPEAPDPVRLTRLAADHGIAILPPPAP